MWGGEVRLFALADENEIARLVISLMEKLLNGKCASTRETQREEVVKLWSAPL
jgi:hypothetical protein